MALLKWDDKLSVGVPLLDEQHKLISETFNELHRATMRSAPRGQIGLLLRSLLAYSRNHFATEETLMSATGYPDLARHRELHADIIQKATKFVSSFDKGSISVNLLVLHFVRDTLIHHVEKVDRLYGPWLVEHGVLERDFDGYCSNDICADANRGVALGSAARS